MKLITRTCKCCGATLTSIQNKCDYCGAEYLFEDEDKIGKTDVLSEKILGEMKNDFVDLKFGDEIKHFYIGDMSSEMICAKPIRSGFEMIETMPSRTKMKITLIEY